MIINDHDNIIALHTFNKPLKLAPAFKCHAQADLYLVPHKRLILLRPKKGAIHPRRRNLQCVLGLDGVFHIHHATDLTADFLAVVNADAILGIVYKDPQHGLIALGAILDAPELVTQAFHHRPKNVFQLFKLA